MGSTENINASDIRFQGLLERYLRLRHADKTSQETSFHLDEDTLAAFSEGTLLTREATPVVSHLADCSFCRHKTAELIKLDLAFAKTAETSAAAEVGEPSRVSEVLGGILSRLFGTGEGAVFAHEEKAGEKDGDDPKDNEDKEEQKEGS